MRPHATVEATLLQRLRAFATPTVANALECLGLSPGTGYSDATIVLQTPNTNPFVGRASTATISTLRATDHRASSIPVETWWRYVEGRPNPQVVVCQDLDPAPDGAMWGEMMGRLHVAMGVTGIVTNGAVRDVAELAALHLPVLAGRTCVSHAFARFVALDTPVRVAGLDVRPGDLLHGDRHGIQLIPEEVVLQDLVRTCERIEELEQELFTAADTFDHGLDGFLTTWANVRSRWPGTTDDAI